MFYLCSYDMHIYQYMFITCIICQWVYICLPTHCTGHPDSQLIKRRQAQLENEYNDLSKMASTRHQRLQESLKVQEFYRQAEEEEAWMKEKEQLCLQSDTGKDVRTVLK